MLLVNKQNLTLASDRRLVKAAEVATVRSAEEIIATAEAEAARIREEAKTAFEEEKKKGYAKGLADGKLDEAEADALIADAKEIGTALTA
jgi:type III secretion protein L